jgi:hypothetical protein
LLIWTTLLRWARQPRTRRSIGPVSHRLHAPCTSSCCWVVRLVLFVDALPTVALGVASPRDPSRPPLRPPPALGMIRWKWSRILFVVRGDPLRPGAVAVRDDDPLGSRGCGRRRHVQATGVVAAAARQRKRHYSVMALRGSRRHQDQAIGAGDAGRLLQRRRRCVL